MSASLVSGYTGLLEDVHVVSVAKILGVPLSDGAVVYGRFTKGGPTEYVSYAVQRERLFEKIIEFQSNAQVEAEVLAILARYAAALNAQADRDAGVRMSVPERISALADELRHIYAIIEDRHSGGLVMR